MGERFGVRSFLVGVRESLAIVALFVVAGLGAAAWLDSGAGAAPGYPAGVPPADATPRVWLVDAYNLIHVALLRDRPRDGRGGERLREELLERVAAFDEPEAELWVVFDGGQPCADDAGARVHPVFAPSADEWLLARVRDSEPGAVALVTADRRLAERARARGAEIVAPGAFLARCPESDAPTTRGSMSS